MTTRCLAPRFGQLIGLMQAARTHLEVGDARAAAVEVARECGYSFDQALAELRRPSIQATAEPDDTSAAEPLSTHVDKPADDGCPAYLSTPRDAAIAAALAADPGRADRDIARELRCSPTTVGRARAAAGLSGAVRQVRRGAQAYEMRQRPALRPENTL